MPYADPTDAVRHRREHPEINQAASRRYRERHRDRKRQQVRDWEKRNPEKVAAHQAVQRALRKGLLVRGVCEEPDCTEIGQAHHDDYSRPLEVRWRCRLHHKLIHRTDT